MPYGHAESNDLLRNRERNLEFGVRLQASPRVGEKGLGEVQAEFPTISTPNYVRVASPKEILKTQGAGAFRTFIRPA